MNRTFLFSLFAMLLLTFPVLAQVQPQSFNYQAVIRDQSGTLLVDQQVSIRISILEGSSSGTQVYQETHSLQTNMYGIVNLQVGRGTPVSGDFDTISWATASHFISVEADLTGGSTYIFMGTSELLAVPYALYSLNGGPTGPTGIAGPTGLSGSDGVTGPAGIDGVTGPAGIDGATGPAGVSGNDGATGPSGATGDDGLPGVTGATGPTGTSATGSIPGATGQTLRHNGTDWEASSKLYNTGNNIGIGTTSPSGKLEVQGEVTDSANVPLFEVKDKDGNTVFAVYPEGARVFIQEGSTTSNSGFSVFGRDGATETEWMKITEDSIRFYVMDDGGSKSSNRGGFAVSGKAPNKSLSNEYLRVTPDSVRVYIDTDDSVPPDERKGFGVGGFREVVGNADSLVMQADREGFNVVYLTTTERDAILSPRLSSMIFNTTDSCLQIFLGYWESIWCTPMNCVYPSIVDQPVNQALWPGGDVTFSVLATGSKLYYKWMESPDNGITWRFLTDGGTSPQYSGVRNDTMMILNASVSQTGYLYKCHITNACGTEISNPAALIVGCGTIFTDIRDGQSYPTVQLGDQCWMAKNLNVGTMITSVAGGQLQTNNALIEKYCLANMASYCVTYGGLYEWTEMMQYSPSDAGDPGTTQGICPAGWHIPTNLEWTELAIFLIDSGYNWDGTTTGNKIARSMAANAGWNTTATTGAPGENLTLNNMSGFSGLAGGDRDQVYGDFYGLGTTGTWWAATESDATKSAYKRIEYNYVDLRIGNDFKTRGFSVRCIKD
ncbi:MAG: hypothetical protein KKA07_15690 [Bacteroidetes bacterium]|nr:hypothetical protein [Bacteroidota bacterium]MBU1720506.1 hypothetical protein [Bacteroidota bacterium]